MERSTCSHFCHSCQVGSANGWFGFRRAEEDDLRMASRSIGAVPGVVAVRTRQPAGRPHDWRGWRCGCAGLSCAGRCGDATACSAGRWIKRARTSLDSGPAGRKRGNAEWMNGKAKRLGDRYACFICYHDERCCARVLRTVTTGALRTATAGAARGHCGLRQPKRECGQPKVISQGLAREHRPRCGKKVCQSHRFRLSTTGPLDYEVERRNGIAGPGLASESAQSSSIGETGPARAPRKLAFARELAEYDPTQREPCQPKLVFAWPPPIYGRAV